MNDFGIDPDILDAIKAVLCRYPSVISAGIFGSRARGNYKNYSDIDLAIHAPSLTILEFMDIRNDLSNLPTIFKIDSVHVDETSKPELLANIQRDERIFYSKGDV